MTMFYARLIKGRDVIELVGEPTPDSLLAAARKAQELLANGWTFVPQAELAAEVRTATIPRPGHWPTVQ
jgi:hypothetical protein